MKYVTKILTFDGGLHDSEAAAVHHVEGIYGAKLSEVAHKITRLEKYGKIVEFLDAELNRFIDLAAIKADLTMERREE